MSKEKRRLVIGLGLAAGVVAYLYYRKKGAEAAMNWYGLDGWVTL